MPCLSTKHQQTENSSIQESSTWKTNTAAQQEALVRSSQPGTQQQAEVHIPFQGRRNLIPFMVSSRRAAEMVTAITNPSSSLASLFGKVITHNQKQKVEQIKGSASLTHSYTQPQRSQDPPAL